MTSMHGQSVGKWKLLVKQAINLLRIPKLVVLISLKSFWQGKLFASKLAPMFLRFGQSAEMKYLFWCYCSSRSWTLTRSKTFLITFYKVLQHIFENTFKRCFLAALHSLIWNEANGAESGIKYSNWSDMQSAVCVWVAQRLLVWTFRMIINGLTWIWCGSLVVTVLVLNFKEKVWH